MQCGCHVPYRFSFNDLPLPDGFEYDERHHNCSGKHSGFLAYCALNELPAETYTDLTHPLQLQVRKAVADVAGIASEDLAWGIDGCSAPNFAMPLSNLAQAYARVAQPESNNEYGASLKLLGEAMSAHPELVSGTGRSDADFMRVGVVLACNNFEIIDMGVMVPAEKIIAKAIEENVDVIGLSGLITPSLDEMVHVAKEMERLGMDLPLLIGGATTSRAHTSVKIDPHYSGPVVHVLDASKSVPVAQSLISKTQRDATKKKFKADYEQFRIDYKNRKKDKNFVSIKKAREHKMKLEFNAIVKPIFLGTKVFDDFSLEQLRGSIDWTPFFQTWELSGKYPAIFDDQIIGIESKKLFDDANKMLDEVISKKLLKAKGVIGFWEANSVDDDVQLNHNEEQTTIHFLRQQNEKTADQFYYCLSDFIAPKETGKPDYIGGFAVTAGIGIETLVEAFEKDHDDYQSIMIKAIADRLAEAFAEKMHELVRKEYWAYAKNENISVEEIIKEKYDGIRPAPGYPACPDHTEKRKLFDLLNVESET